MSARPLRQQQLKVVWQSLAPLLMLVVVVVVQRAAPPLPSKSPPPPLRHQETHLAQVLASTAAQLLRLSLRLLLGHRRRCPRVRCCLCRALHASVSDWSCWVT